MNLAKIIGDLWVRLVGDAGSIVSCFTPFSNVVSSSGHVGILSGSYNVVGWKRNGKLQYGQPTHTKL